MEPDMIGLVRLYRTDEGGKRLPIDPAGKYYGCVAMRDPDTRTGNDVRLILTGVTDPIQPGDTVELPMKFLTPEGSRVMREAGRFFLWEGRAIGEVEVRG